MTSEARQHVDEAIALLDVAERAMKDPVHPGGAAAPVAFLAGVTAAAAMLGTSFSPVDAGRRLDELINLAVASGPDGMEVVADLAILRAARTRHLTDLQLVDGDTAATLLEAARRLVDVAIRCTGPAERPAGPVDDVEPG